MILNYEALMQELSAQGEKSQLDNYVVGLAFCNGKAKYFLTAVGNAGVHAAMDEIGMMLDKEMK
jgi:hypothetical protein